MGRKTLPHFLLPSLVFPILNFPISSLGWYDFLLVFPWKWARNSNLVLNIKKCVCLQCILRSIYLQNVGFHQARAVGAGLGGWLTDTWCAVGRWIWTFTADNADGIPETMGLSVTCGSAFSKLSRCLRAILRSFTLIHNTLQPSGYYMY